MSRRQVIEKAIEVINQLPDEKVGEVVDFASLVLKRHEETTSQKGIERLAETSNTFAFLHSEEDLYTLEDLKERYK